MKNTYVSILIVLSSKSQILNIEYHVTKSLFHPPRNQTCSPTLCEFYQHAQYTCGVEF